MNSIISTIEDEELKLYIGVLKRVLSSEELISKNSDLSYHINNLRKLLEDKIDEVEMNHNSNSEYVWGPKEVAKSWKISKVKINRDMIFKDIKYVYKDKMGLEFCDKVVDYLMIYNSEIFIESSGGVIGDIVL